MDSAGLEAPEECLQKLDGALQANRCLRNMAPVTWSHRTWGPPLIPQQGIGDCGMNVLATIDCLAAGKEVSGFDKNDIATMRMKLRQLLCSCRDRRDSSLPPHTAHR